MLFAKLKLGAVLAPAVLLCACAESWVENKTTQEQALTVSDEQLFLQYESALVNVHSQIAKGMIRFRNPSSDDSVFGIKADECAGQSFSDCLHIKLFTSNNTPQGTIPIEFTQEQQRKTLWVNHMRRTQARPGIVDMAVHQRSVLALLADNKLYFWGEDKHSLLVPSELNALRPVYSSPTEISFFNDKEILDFDLNDKMAVVVLHNGDIWVWGQQSYCQPAQDETFCRLSGVGSAKAAALGDGHLLVLTATGELWSWGNNSFGQRGTSPREINPGKSLVELPDTSAIVSVYAQKNFSLVLDDQGVLYSWGDNNTGQLGRQAGSTVLEWAKPGQVVFPQAVKVQKISLASTHVLALDQSGKLWAWGSGAQGELGEYVSGVATVPVSIHHAGALVDIAAGETHNTLLDQQGQVWVLGRVSQTHDPGLPPHTESQYVYLQPKQLSSVAPATRVFAGDQLNFAFLDTCDNNSRALWSWGDEQHFHDGALGRGMIHDLQGMPAPVVNIADDGSCQQQRVIIYINGDGEGTIKSDQVTLQCDHRFCWASADKQTTASFNALAGESSEMLGWSWDCGNGDISVSTLDFSQGHVCKVSFVQKGGDHAPQAVIQAPRVANEHSLITFRATPSRDDKLIVAYQWEFSDETQLEGKEVSHSFIRPPEELLPAGEYWQAWVRLTVRDNAGQTNSQQHMIRLSPVSIDTAPYASFQYSPDRIINGQSVHFDASPSSDDQQISTYAWFVDEQLVNTSAAFDYIFDLANADQHESKIIKLTVTDSAGQSSDAFQSILVNPVDPGVDALPTASFVMDRSEIYDGDQLNVDASNSTDDRGILAYQWDFGDGSSGTGMQAAHTFTLTDRAVAQDFLVTLTIFDNGGQKSNVQKSIKVLPVINQPPSAVLVASTSLASEGERIDFDASDSTDDGGIVTYRWDFGDGSQLIDTTSPAMSYTFALDTGKLQQDFTVTVTAIDDFGLQSTDSITIGISAQTSVGLLGLSVTTDASVSFDSSELSQQYGDAETLVIDMHPDSVSGQLTHRRTYLRFDLEEQNIQSAELRLVLAAVAVPANSSVLSVGVYGIRDGFGAENWSESTLSGNTAPAYVAESIEPVADQSVYLGSIAISANAVVDTEFTLANDALIRFMQNNVSGKLGLVLINETLPSAGETAAVAFYSRENTAGKSGAQLSYEVRPEKTSITASDSYISYGNAASNYATAGSLRVRSRSGEEISGEKAYLQFALPVFQTADLLAVELDLINCRAPRENVFEYRLAVYALENAHAGENWLESGISWNNAPANALTSTSSLNSQEVSRLGELVYSSQKSLGGVLRFSPQALKQAVEQDDNGRLTLIIVDENLSGQTANLCSKENDYNYAGPQLTLHWTGVP